MNKATALVLGAILTGGTIVAGSLALGSTTSAQAEAWQYGYIMGVPRLESYEIDVSRWAAGKEDKDYLVGHVFVYEQGQTTFSDKVGSLRKLNELAAKGWEVVDAQQGLIRRKR